MSARAENHTLYNAILAPHTYDSVVCVCGVLCLPVSPCLQVRFRFCFLGAVPCAWFPSLQMHSGGQKIKNRAKINTYSIHDVVYMCVSS